jgi:protein gp37
MSEQSNEGLVEHLLQVNGKKFLSVEPQISYIKLKPNWLIGSPDYKGQIDWVIQGGESGHPKRSFDLAWARSIRDQCLEYKVPYFFKQIDKVQPIPEDLQVRQFL